MLQFFDRLVHLLRIPFISLLLLSYLSGCDDSGFALQDFNEAPLIPSFTIKDSNGRERNGFVPGETITLEYQLKNNTNQQVTISAGTTPPCVFNVSQNGTLIWSSPVGLLLVVDTIILNPLESLDCSVQWNGTDQAGIEVAMGQYQVDLVRNFTAADFALREVEPQAISINNYIPVPAGAGGSDLIAADFRILDQFDQEASSFLVGEPITFMISYTNITYNPITHYYTGYFYECEVYMFGQLIWRSLDNRAYIQIVVSSTIGAMETKQASCIWDGRDNQGNLLAPMTYTVVPSIGFGVFNSGGEYISVVPALEPRTFTIHY